MSITIVENIILNIILVVFPLLVYLVLVIYNDNTSKKNNSNLMTITLITSLYLCIRFGSLEPNTKVLLFCNIPIVIAYMQKKPILAIMLSLANVIYCYYMFHSLMIIIIIKYISYLILYLCARKKNLSVNGFILSIAVIQGFFLSFEYFFRTTNITINDFLELIILVFVYYFVTFAIVYIFRVTQKVESLNKTVKLLEKDKKIDFIIIGAQKCGTTSLHDYMNQHPFCTGAWGKETLLFTKRYRGQLKLKRLVGYFSFNKLINNRVKCLFFESTPDNVYEEVAPGRIYEYNP